MQLIKYNIYFVYCILVYSGKFDSATMKTHTESLKNAFNSMLTILVASSTEPATFHKSLNYHFTDYWIRIGKIYPEVNLDSKIFLN